MQSERHFIPTRTPPRSLCWLGDGLIDWVDGGTHYSLDGTETERLGYFTFRFDSALCSTDGQFAVLYEALGTKGLVVHNGRVLRELNRSYYHATAYEYPLALVTLPSGRTLLAHCPDDYCRIELEDLETGARLTRRESESPDIFHSRLQFSRDGRYLLSAGWVWHPFDVAEVFEVPRVLEAPETLDKPGCLEHCKWDGGEISAAVFGERDQLILSGEGNIGVYSLTEQRFLSVAPLEEPAGTLMAMGEYAVGFYQHPKLIELSTGRTVARWPELSTGLQTSSIRHHLHAPPPLALDPVGRRFAVGTAQGIEVVQLPPSAR